MSTKIWNTLCIHLRVGLTKATARAKAAAKQAVKTGKNAIKKEDK